jgi:hypothetical protein
VTFSQPSAGGDQFDPKEHNGRLTIVFPKSFSAETPTIHGVGPSADCDIVLVDAVDATGKPLYFENARLFGNLAKSVSRDLGGAVLGRLGQVPTQRGNPAWVLQQFTDQEAAMAGPALTAYQAGQFKQAENPQAAAAGPSPATTPQAPAPAATWQAPTQAAATAPPAQQWNAGAPAGPPQTPAPAQAQWQAPQTPAAGPPAYQAPAQQAASAAAPPAQWQAPPAAAAAPTQPSAPAPVPAAAIDPGLIKYLADRGINGPFPDQATAEAIAATLPQ